MSGLRPRRAEREREAPAPSDHRWTVSFMSDGKRCDILYIGTDPVSGQVLDVLKAIRKATLQEVTWNPDHIEVSYLPRFQLPYLPGESAVFVLRDGEGAGEDFNPVAGPGYPEYMKKEAMANG